MHNLSQKVDKRYGQLSMPHVTNNYHQKEMKLKHNNQ